MADKELETGGQGSSAPRSASPFQRRADILAAAFLAGALAQTSQLVLLRELLAAFSGLEITLGLALGSWMGLVAAGGWAAAALLRLRVPARRVLGLLLGTSALPVGASAILARIAPAAAGLARGEFPGLGASLGLSVLALAPACLLVGSLFVACSKGLEEAAGGAKAGKAVGLAYLLEAAGSAAAGAAFTFLLAPLGSFTVLAAACGLASLAAAAGFAREGRRGAVPAALALLAGCAGLLLPIALDARTAARMQAGPRGSGGEATALLGWRDSRYGRILATRRAGQTDFFLSGHFAFSLPDREAASSLAHPVLLEHPKPERVLLVGGGASGLIEEVLKHGVKRVDYVELDPALVETAREFEPERTKCLEDPRVRFVPGDGRAFVMRAASGSYDVALVDVPDPDTAGLNRYYTLEFFRELREALAPDGVAAFTLSGASNAMGEEVLNRNGSIYHTFLAAFPEVRVWPGDRFVYVGACRPGALSLDPAELAARFRARAIQFPWRCPKCPGPEFLSPGACPSCGGALAEARFFTEHHFWMMLEREDVLRVNRELRAWPASAAGAEEARTGAPRALPPFMTGSSEKEKDPWEEPPPPRRRALNTDANPSAYLHNLFVWNRVMGEGAWAGALRVVSGLGGWLWAILGAALALPLAIAGAVRTIPRRAPPAAAGGEPVPRAGGAWALRWGLACAVGAMGFAAISLEMVVLLAFQSQYGYVYGAMGALFGAFMLGLGAGGWLSLRTLAGRGMTASATLLGTAGLAAALPYAVAALGALPPSAALPFHLALAALCGLPLGILFPAAASAYAGAEGDARGTAAAVYGADLVGGIAGALLAGPLLIPALGIRDAMWLEVVPMLLTGAAVLAVGRRMAGSNAKPGA